MLTAQMIEFLEEIIHTLESSYLLKVLGSLTVAAEEFLAATNQTIDQPGGNAVAPNDQARNKVARHVAEFKQINIADLFGEIFRIQAYLRDFHAGLENRTDTTWIDGFLTRLQQFSTDYQAFVRDYQFSALLKLTQSAYTLHGWTHSAIATMRVIALNLKGTAAVSSPEVGRVTIYLSSDLRVSEMIEKLVAVHNMYAELCMLLGVLETEHPLRAAKIESGSWWMDLLGLKPVMDLISKSLEAAAGFVYRNFTTEGKISAIPKKLESIEALLLHAKRMEAEGLEASEQLEYVEKSSVKVTRDAFQLIGGEPAVRINGTEYAIPPAFRPALSRGKEQLRLEQQPRPDEP